jgi:hypothetical protein
MLHGITFWKKFVTRYFCHEQKLFPGGVAESLPKIPSLVKGTKIFLFSAETKIFL